MSKNHKWANVGAFQYSKLGLPPDSAASYERCELCNATVEVRYNSGEGLGEAIDRSGISQECPNGIEQLGGKKIFCFVNGGSPGWYDAIAICEDGHCLAGHLCSSHGWAPHDLGIGSDWKHDKYKEHCPEGFELIWVDDPRSHEGLTAAIEANKLLPKEEVAA